MLRNALEGLAVLDFTQIGAGPTCTMLLADMGARVVKVEPPNGEMGRTLGPGWIGEDSAVFHSFNRNKLGLSLDLKKPDAVAVARRLAAASDVVVESMRPGVLSRLGLGFDTLNKDHPGLIYCSITAYGQSGPYAQRAGVDGILQADSGLMSLIGLDGAEPCKVQAPVVDVMSGYVAAMAILAKLNQRARDGRGGHLDVNLLNSALALQQSSITSYFADGNLPSRVGSAAPYSAPNQAFPTQDGWLMVAAYTPDRWARLCEVLGLHHLQDDPRFATSSARMACRSEMVKELSAVFRKKSTADWEQRLLRADILCAPVSGYEEVEKHPQVLFNLMVSTQQNAKHGPIRTPGFPVNSAASNTLAHRPAPACGEHSREVLRQVGFSDADVDAFVEAGAVHCAD